MTVAETILLVAAVVLAVGLAWELVRVSRSSVATGAQKRNVVGLEFLVLMLIAALVLDDLAGDDVRDRAAWLLGLAGIVLVLTGFRGDR